MTMYFVQSPTRANQLLLRKAACYSLALLLIVILQLCRASDGPAVGGTQPLARPTPAVGAGGEGDWPALPPFATASNSDAQQKDREDQKQVGAKSSGGLANETPLDSKNENEKPIESPTVQQQKQPQQDHEPRQDEPKDGRSYDQKNKQKQDQTQLDKLHKLMSEKDLRRTFQVNSHDQVPEYQVLRLTVASDGSHLISPISDLGELLTSSSKSSRTTEASDHQVHGQTIESDSRTARTSRENQQEQATDEKSQEAEHGHRSKRSPEADRPSDRNDQQEDAKPKLRPELQGDRQQTNHNHNQYQKPKQRQKPSAEENHQDQDDKLIVMNLTTFGRDFSLRLKRNADFQQRIKDMKMFLAESVGDGQLRYTEIKQQHHKQEPHKRAASNADAADDDQPQASSNLTATSTDQRPAATPTTKSSGNNNRQHHDWNIGSTYHDEANLAALLIERDRKTGQIKVDGTIGNDFVIKPMPRATIEALVAKQQLAELQSQQSQSGVAKSQQSTSAANAIGVESLANLDLERSSSTSTSDSRAGPTASAAASTTSTRRPEVASSNEFLKRQAEHMHDDDPHDDDEMFLDEDEALELASLQASAASVESNHTNAAAGSSASSSESQPQQAHSLQQQIRALSKAASERKWKKYRKLMAQTQVPKLNQQRARRNADRDSQGQPTEALTMSHHIIYRQKPSSEASSSEHRHSFMLAPGQQSMEEMVRRFPLKKRSTGDNTLDSSGSSSGSSRLSRDDFALSGNEADDAHDPMGGQFYLEPGSVTGYERAGHADWSLVSPRRHPLVVPPPYAFNSSQSAGSNSHEHMGPHLELTGNSTMHARYKRHLGHRGGPRASGSSHRPQGHHPPPPAGVGPPTGNRRHKRQAPDVVWPEVLLVVDYDSFLLHGGDSREVKRYFVSFWNGVDLRYKLLVNPHIRISLAGMIVAKDRDATPYLERNRLRAPNADAVDAAGALTDMGKYLYREDRLPTYDLAVVITKLDMCRRRYEGGRCNRGTAGFAYVGGACVVNKRLEKVNSVAIIEDSGGFSGIIVAAHEVGHLLGCVHDGSPPPSYLGGPGATHCPWEDGFIMSDLRHTERGFRWSQCSVEQFKHFLNGETATCLYNYPHESQMLHRLLPGSMLSLDDQCKRDRGTNACFKDARVCAQLFCFDSASGYCVSYRPAAEGSPCGDGHVCRNGKCVGEIENIIPDYTHQSQTVVAAAGAVGAPAARQRSLGGQAALPSARLADNGLSASSTSTATSPPDGTSTKLNQAAAGPSSAATSTVNVSPPVSSRRMDTFALDAPTSNNMDNGHLLYGSTSTTQSADNYQQQSLPINYHNNHQKPNLIHNTQQQQSATVAVPYHKRDHLAVINGNQQHGMNQSQKKAKLVHHQQTSSQQQGPQRASPASYADFTHSTTALNNYNYAHQPTNRLGVPHVSELYASSSSVSPRSISVNAQQAGQSSHGNNSQMRRHKQQQHYQQPPGGLGATGLLASSSSSSPSGSFVVAPYQRPRPAASTVSSSLTTAMTQHDSFNH